MCKRLSATGTAEAAVRVQRWESQGRAPLNRLKPLERAWVNGFKVGEEVTRDGQELILRYLLWTGEV